MDDYDYRIIPYMTGTPEEREKLFAPYKAEGWSMLFVGVYCFTLQKKKSLLRRLFGN